MNAKEARELFPLLTTDIVRERIAAGRKRPNKVREQIQAEIAKRSKVLQKPNP